MSKIRKAVLASVVFLVLWIGWCFLAISAGVHFLMGLMNISAHVVGPALCGVPLLIYAMGLIYWYSSSTKK